MYITTNIGLRDYQRTGIIWHGSYHETLGKGGSLLIGHGIRRDMIGHPIPPGAAAGIAQLDVTGDSAEELSGGILFLS
jgi:hypothetical protein